MRVDPERVKKIDNLTVIFKHFGSARIEALRKMLIKLSPRANLTKLIKTKESSLMVHYLNLDMTVTYYDT